MENTKTAREIAKEAKGMIDLVVVELVEKYGLSKIETATVMDVLRTEAGAALYELRHDKRILTNKERWT